MKHHVVHEWEHPMGGRFWTGPFRTAEANAEDYRAHEAAGYVLSDTDCAVTCPEPECVTRLTEWFGEAYLADHLERVAQDRGI